MNNHTILIDKLIGSEQKKNLFLQWLNSLTITTGVAFVRDSNLHETMLIAKIDIAFGDAANNGAFSIRYCKAGLPIVTLMIEKWQEIEESPSKPLEEEFKISEHLSYKITRARVAGWSVIQSGNKWILKNPNGLLHAVSHISAERAWAELP